MSHRDISLVETVMLWRVFVPSERLANFRFSDIFNGNFGSPTNSRIVGCSNRS
jgi:hypothetical protein